MTTESASAGPSQRPVPIPQPQTPGKRLSQPWISCLGCIACIGIFLGLAGENNYESWDSLSKWGYLPANSIWDGAYWALLSSVFVHFAVWHVGFNVYWLWVLGSRLEKTIGSFGFLAFFVTAAFVSSSVQLAVADDTGIGASGVVYAMFGFMWVACYRFPQFREVLDWRTISVFLAWLVGCIVTTYFRIWEVANAAHIAGLAFGFVIAGYFVAHLKRPVMLACLTAVLLVSVVPLFWCPWSVTWLSHKAYHAHAGQRYEEAVGFYTRIIDIDPDNAWAYYNRSGAYQALAEPEKAEADLKNARALGFSVEKAD